MTFRKRDASRESAIRGCMGGLEFLQCHWGPHRHSNCWRFLCIFGTFITSISRFLTFQANLKGGVCQNFLAPLTVSTLATFCPVALLLECHLRMHHLLAPFTLSYFLCYVCKSPSIQKLYSEHLVKYCMLPRISWQNWWWWQKDRHVMTSRRMKGIYWKQNWVLSSVVHTKWSLLVKRATK